MVDENVISTFKPADEMVIDDLETLRVLADPLRLSIIEFLVKPGTVKRIAEKLDKPPTKLYYHFNLLEKHNLITLVDTRIVSGIIEKHYQASAHYYRLKRGLLSPSLEGAHELDRTLSSLFADNKNDILQGVEQGIIDVEAVDGEPKRLTFSTPHFFFTPEQAQAFSARLKALIHEFQPELNTEQPAGTDLYKLMYIYFPSSRSWHMPNE